MSVEENIAVRTTSPMAGESMGERRLTTKGIAFFGALTVFLLLLHAADEIARGEAAQTYGSVGGAALFLILLFVLYVLGIGWTWKERKLGYVIVLVLSPFAFGRFLFHAFTLFGSVSLEAIAAAYTSEAVGAFFVFVYLALALTSLMALLLSIYALAVPKQELNPPRGAKHPMTPRDWVVLGTNLAALGSFVTALVLLADLTNLSAWSAVAGGLAWSAVAGGLFVAALGLRSLPKVTTLPVRGFLIAALALASALILGWGDLAFMLATAAVLLGMQPPPGFRGERDGIRL